MTERIKAFRTSSNCAYLTNFLRTPTGVEFMEILRESAEPKKSKDGLQQGTGQDFIAQLALAHNYRLGQFDTLNMIKSLSEPDAKGKIEKPNPETGMDLEPEDIGDGKPVKKPAENN